jgi:hypothetical protein
LNAASSASASERARGLIVMMQLIVGPFLSYASMRSKYACTSACAVSVPDL